MTTSTAGTKCSKPKGEYCRLHNPAPTAEILRGKIDAILSDRKDDNPERTRNYSTRMPRVGLNITFNPHAVPVQDFQEDDVVYLYARPAYDVHGEEKLDESAIFAGYHTSSDTARRNDVMDSYHFKNMKDLQEKLAVDIAVLRTSLHSTPEAPDAADKIIRARRLTRLYETLLDKERTAELEGRAKQTIEAERRLDRGDSGVSITRAAQAVEAFQYVSKKHPLASAKRKAEMVHQILIVRYGWEDLSKDTDVTPVGVPDDELDYLPVVNEYARRSREIWEALGQKRY